MLQFGHDLSAVETSVYATCYTSGYMLQFGHDLSAVETRFDLYDHRFHFVASIRPRPFSRGNEAKEGDPAKVKYASIRPRPFSRGNYLSEPDESLLLQSFNSATTFQPWKRQLCLAGCYHLPHASIRPRPFSRGNIAMMGLWQYLRM